MIGLPPVSAFPQQQQQQQPSQLLVPTSSFDNAKKCIQNLKNLFQPLPFLASNNNGAPALSAKAVSQEFCIKIMRALAEKELSDIQQVERDEKQRQRDSQAYLNKRKISQRTPHSHHHESNLEYMMDIDEDEEEDDLEVIKIKKIKRNEIADQIALLQSSATSVDHQNKNNNDEDGGNINSNSNQQAFLVEHNAISVSHFEKCFNASLIGMIYSDFTQPYTTLAKLFHSLDTIDDIFKNLTTIYINQTASTLNPTPMIFEQCFGYVAEEIILERESFINDIIRDQSVLRGFIERTKIRTEQLYILLSRVIQQEYRTNTSLFTTDNNEFSPLLKLFTQICAKHNDTVSSSIVLKHQLRINQSRSLLEKAQEIQSTKDGEAALKEAFSDKLDLLRNQGLDKNESEHISTFLVYMVIHFRYLFQDLFESFQQYNQSVQQHIMSRLSRDRNKKKIKDFLVDKSSSSSSILPAILAVFEYNNSYLLQVFAFELLSSSSSLIDATQKQNILEQLVNHVNQTPNIFDFYKKFPQYFTISIIEEYNNIKDLQASTPDALREKYAFITNPSTQQQLHYILLSRSLVEDCWFITKQNMKDFLNYFFEHIEFSQIISMIRNIVESEKANINSLLVPMLLKAATIAQATEHELVESIDQIAYDIAATAIWTVNQTFATGLKLYFNALCSQSTKEALEARLVDLFTNTHPNEEVLEQFQQVFLQSSQQEEQRQQQQQQQ